MEEQPASSQAWQPLTFRGAARFANSRSSRLLLVQSIVAFSVALAIIWFCSARFSPVIAQAVQHFSEQTQLVGGKIVGLNSGLLADGKFLSISANFAGSGEQGTADVQIKLAPDYFDLCSLFGCVSLLYPNVNTSLSRSVAEPWWGAWQPAILAGIGLAVICLLFLSWLVLALLYQWPVRLMAYLADREVSGKSSRRLAIAAQMPAALFMGLAIVLYGLQALDLVQFLVFYALHFIIAWVYVFVAPLFLPRLASTTSLRDNPFAAATPKS